jgi:hypothetical protein
MLKGHTAKVFSQKTSAKVLLYHFALFYIYQ